MKNKQTAVDWLFLMLNDPNRNQDFAKKLYDKAKEIEKEQIIKACHVGFYDGVLFKDDAKTKFKNTEEYYNETYK